MRWLIFISIILIGSLPVTAFADYAWIPEHEHLQIRGGIDFYSTGQNYATDGFLEVPRFSGQTINFNDTMFWLKPEFGVAEDWSLGTTLGFSNSVAVSDGTGGVLASGLGFMDWWFNTKWRVSKKPLWVMEASFKLPTGVATASAADELVVGEGNIDVGLKAHYGYQSGSFYFSGSPGFLGRFGGYSAAFTADAAVQMFFYRAYAKIFVNSIFSLTPTALAPSTVDAHTLAGTAGSYARLAASPTGIVAGGAIGAMLTKNFRLEGGLTRTVWGARIPNYTSFTINLLSTFDMTKPDYRPKVKEVPFENAPAEF